MNNLIMMQQMVLYYIQQNINIQTMKEENNESQVSQMSFKKGNIVWAKITGYPWWPATITSIQQQQQPLFRVDFIADRTHAYLSSNKIVSYQQGREEYQNTKKTNKQLYNAFLVAEQRYSAHVNTKQQSSELLKQHFKQQQLQNQLIQTKEEGKQLHFQLKITVQKQMYINTAKSSSYSLKKQKVVLKEKLINDLLTRYNLHQIPKTHPISKKHHRNVKKCQLQLLIRKIYKYLKPKLINRQKCCGIAIAFAQYVLNFNQHGLKCQYLLNLLRWIRVATFDPSVSQEEIMEKYNDRWEEWGKNCHDREKPSNMTTYQ